MLRRSLCLLFAIVSIGLGQQSPRKVEVSSVHASEFPNETFFSGYASFAGPCGAMVTLRITGSSFAVQPTSLCAYIREAYQLQRRQIIGMPRAMAEAKPANYFNIQVKAEGDAPLSRDDMRALLRQVLEDRFHLKFHWEKKKFPVYGLHVAKDRHKLAGADLANCNGPAISLAEMDKRARVLVSCKPTTTMARLAEQLTLGFDGELQVVDRTGLAGEYAFILKWSSDENGTYPTIFTAIQEQLGLKLVEEGGDMDVMVVDQLLYPDPN